MKNIDKNLQLPPDGLQIDKLIGYICDYGSGNVLVNAGMPKPWTPASLSIEMGMTGTNGTTDTTIRNWIAGRTLPKTEQLHKLARVVSCGDEFYLKAWTEALISASTETRRRKKEVETQKKQDELELFKKSNLNESGNSQNVNVENNLNGTPEEMKKHDHAAQATKWLRGKRLYFLLASVLCSSIFVVYWINTNFNTVASAKNIRICDAPYFDKKTKDCTKHVSVFMHGINEVFLSFDFENLAKDAPFERWWIRNGERVAGRTSYNDEAWPGYTFWRPDNGFPVGEYVVRIVVDGKVATQTFSIQKTGFNSN